MAISMLSLLLFSFSSFSLLPTYGYGRINDWKGNNVFATIYDQTDSSGTMGGSCGYGNLRQQGYGKYTAAVSTALFGFGTACGGCLEIKCVGGEQMCLTDRTVTVTVASFCPPFGMCEKGYHFNLAQRAFRQLSKANRAAIPIVYRSVNCTRNGGIRFTITGWYFYHIVLITNVGGEGAVYSVGIKGSKTGWLKMSRTWGQNWVVDTSHVGSLVGQTLSFQVQTSHHKVVTSYNVAKENWMIGRTYIGNQFPNSKA